MVSDSRPCSVFLSQRPYWSVPVLFFALPYDRTDLDQVMYRFVKSFHLFLIQQIVGIVPVIIFSDSDQLQRFIRTMGASVVCIPFRWINTSFVIFLFLQIYLFCHLHIIGENGVGKAFELFCRITYIETVWKFFFYRSLIQQVLFDQ